MDGIFKDLLSDIFFFLKLCFIKQISNHKVYKNEVKEIKQGRLRNLDWHSSASVMCLT